MRLALKYKRFIKFDEDASLGLVEREHHLQMQLQQFATVLGTVGSFRGGSWRGGEEGIVVPTT